jgi:YrbI family 3-deoxy-D-manno-octulosonate 8-phosphate phosphatase
MHAVSHLREAGLDRLVIDTADERIIAAARRHAVECLDLQDQTVAVRWGAHAERGDIVSVDWRYPLVVASDIVEMLRRCREDNAFSVFLGGHVHSLHKYDGPPREGRCEPVERVAGGWIYQLPAVLIRAGREQHGRRGSFAHPAEPRHLLRADTDEGFAGAEAVYFLRSMRELMPRLAKIKLVIFDFDGVFTDNRVVVNEDGREAVVCNRSDGLGIGMLREAGVEVVVLTAELNPAPLRRCEKLKIACVQVEKHKLPALEKILADRKIEPAAAAYVGNDVNDLPCMDYLTQRGGLAITVADAHPQVRAKVRAATRLPGGAGAVREVIDWLIEAKQAAQAKAAAGAAP